MRFEETPTSLVIEQAPGGFMRAVGLFFPVLALLLAGIGILGVVLPPPTMTIECDRAIGTCTTTPSRGRSETHAIADIAAVEAVKQPAQRNRSASLRLQLVLRDDRQVWIGEPDFGGDEKGELVRSRDALAAFFADSDAASVSTTFTAGDTDLFAAFGLALGCAVFTFAFAPLLRSTRVEVTATPRRVRLTTRALFGRADARELDATEIAKLSAWCSNNKGWATLSLVLHTGDEVVLFRLPWTAKGRAAAARSLEVLARVLGLGVEASEPYRRFWMV